MARRYGYSDHNNQQATLKQLTAKYRRCFMVQPMLHRGRIANLSDIRGHARKNLRARLDSSAAPGLPVPVAILSKKSETSEPMTDSGHGSVFASQTVLT